MGYFNLYLIIILAILADIGGDVMYYYLGYHSQGLMNSSLFKFFGLNKRRIEKAKSILDNRMVYAVIAAKMSPVTGPVGTISIFKSSFFVLLGYYSGQAYLHLNKIISRGEYVLFFIFIFLFLAYLFYFLVNQIILKKISK